MRNLVRELSFIALLSLINTPLLSQNALFSNGNTTLFIQESALISIQGNAKFSGNSTIKNLGSLKIKGDFIHTTNQNLFTIDSGLVTLNGTSSQNLIGYFNFHNLTINNGSGVTQSSGNIKLSNTLTIESGILTSNDSFKLKSTETRTARVAEISSGAASGNFTVERYVSSGSNQWRMIAAPVQNTTLQDWIDDFYTSGFPGTPYPTFPFISEVFYDETQLGSFNDGYVNATSASNQIIPGQGVWAYLGPLPLTFDATGPLNQGAFNFNVTYTNGGVSHNDNGWHLLGNPFASTIDWDAPGWIKTNINNAIYIWDGEAGQFRTYVDGIGTNGGSPLIPSSQAFFVQTNAASPQLICTESVKSSTDAPFIYRPTEQHFIRFKLSFENLQDEIVVRFKNEATTQFDRDFDASKTVNQITYAPRIYSTLDSVFYSINTLPLSDSIEIPIILESNWPYWYNLEINEIVDLPKNYCFQLVDLDSNRVYPIDTSLNISVFLDTGISYNNFLLKARKSLEISSQNNLCYGDSLAEIEVYLLTNDTLNYQLLKDELSIDSGIINGRKTFQNLNWGNYEFTVQSESCGIMKMSAVIEEIDSISVQKQIQPDSGNHTGSINLEVSGGTPPYSIFWKNIDFGIGNTVSKLWADTFYFTVFDANNCEKSDFAIVEDHRTIGIKKDNEIHDIRIYPNPVSSELNMTGLSDLAICRIYTSNGILLFERNISPHEKIDLNTLKSGFYILKIQTQGKLFTKAFSKI